MISRRKTIVVTFVGLVGAAMPALARTKKSFAAARFDADHDGTVDLAEAKKAASDVFDKLDTDKDGTLNIKEFQGCLGRKDFMGADRDNDQQGRISCRRRQWFKSADRMAMVA
jgi:Ca2+-binding EF-hand superfamily protein